MLYIASALDSTAVTHSLSVPDLIPNVLVPSLVVAKGNVIEVWDARPDGLVEVAKTEVWGMVVGLEWVVRPDRQPHIVVLTDHPLSRLLMYRFHDGQLQLTASSTITRPSSRTAEFLTSLVADRDNGIVYGSLYTGLLSVMEIGDWESEIVTARRSVKGKRKESTTLAAQENQSRPNVQDAQMQGALVFREQYEVTISEHNLLSLAVFPYTAPGSPNPSQAVALLYLTPDYTVNLVARTLDRQERAFVDLCSPVDVLSATYNHREFSVPAAKRLLTMDDGVVVIGDEFSAKYTLGIGRPRSASQSSVGASASLRMSPDQTKRRKGSQGGSVGAPGSALGAMSSATGETIAPPTLSWQKGWRVRQGFGDVTGATAISAGPSSVALLGDSFGRMTLISSAAGSRKAIVQSLSRTTSPASCISHIDGLVFFLGSQAGDSQVVQLQLGSPATTFQAGKKGKSKGKEVEMMQIDEEEEVSGATAVPSGLEVLSTWHNLGPIRDFCLVEDREGGSHLITASGANSTGSLRVVRSGVGTEELLRIEGIEGVQRMFPIEIEGSGSILVLSTTDGSLALRLTTDSFGDVAAEEISTQWQGFIGSELTLASTRVGPSSIAQVTPSRLVISNLVTGRVNVEWSARDNEIVCADVAASGAVLAMRGGTVAHLSWSEDASGLTQASESLTPLSFGEISAIASHQNAQVVAVGFWGSNIVNLYSLPQMSFLRHISSEPSLPRSLRIKTASGGRIQILVGRGDGRMVMQSLRTDGQGKIDRRENALGAQPIVLSPLFDGGSELGGGATLAIGDKVSLVYEENGRTSYSALGGKDVAAAALGRLPGLGDCVFASTPNALTVQSIQSVKKLHIRKVEMGGFDPIAIAHDPRAGVLGVAITLTVIDQQYGDEYTEGAFRLYDDTSMAVCAELTLDSGESPTIVQSVVIDGKPFFCLGTVYTDEPDDSGAASRGKLRLLEVMASKDMQPSIVVAVAHDTKGPVLDCKTVWNHLAICVDHQVELLALERNSLRSVSSWGSCFIASCLSVQRYLDAVGQPKERLHVGDGMRSVFALDLLENQLMDVGRDMKPHWVVSMEELQADGGAVVLADTSYNVLTIRHADNKLENAAALALHETVTRFKPGALVPDSVDPTIARPEVIFATSSGRVGIIADLGPGASDTLNELQRNLDSVAGGPAMDWRRYREIHTEGSARPRPTVGFIDGDFIKTFLDRSTDIDWATSVINGTSEFSRIGVAEGGQPATLEDVVKVVEAVSRMH